MYVNIFELNKNLRINYYITEFSDEVDRRPIIRHIFSIFLSHFHNFVCRKGQNMFLQSSSIEVQGLNWYDKFFVFSYVMLCSTRGRNPRLSKESRVRAF